MPTRSAGGAVLDWHTPGGTGQASTVCSTAALGPGATVSAAAASTNLGLAAPCSAKFMVV